MTRVIAVTALIWCMGIAHPAIAQDVEQDSLERDYAVDLPRIAPHEPEDTAETFVIDPAFEMQLVAAEPLVHDPIAMAFDEKGRLFVVEMRGYSERRDENIGAIRLLTDVDGDGVYDTSDVYVDGLAWPTAIACYDGGVYVGIPPDIFYFKDTDGDNRADIHEHVYTGFGLNNVQGLLNSFNWGLDNRIHGATSSSGGAIHQVDNPDFKPVAVGGRDFSFDPATRDFRAESGGAQHGLTFDLDGHKLVCHNSDHMMMLMYEDRYIARNPYLAAPSPRLSIAVDGPQADVFRQSPVEAWRIVRTRLRVKGIVSGPVEGGGTASGYFTSATGITAYKGTALPEEFRGQVFVADVGSNLIHRKQVTPKGIEFEASRLDDGKEFIASTDNWFRPVQFANGPDGALYVADMYREVIEHPDSLPPLIKKHLDLNAGFDRGRIYRIVPKNFEQPKIPDLSKLDDDALAAMVAHPNAWHHATAARLISERKRNDISNGNIEGLRNSVLANGDAQGRMQAMNALAWLGGFDETTAVTLLSDASPLVREHAIRLSEPLLAQSKSVLQKLVSMAKDTDPRVRYQLAYSLGEHPAAQNPPDAFVQLAKDSANDRWMRLAMLSSLTSGAGEVLAVLLDDEAFGNERDERDFLGQLALQVGATGQAEDLKLVLDRVDNLPSGSRSSAVVRGVIDGLQLAPGNPETQAILAKSKSAGFAVTEMIAKAKTVVNDASQSDADRTTSIQSLRLSPYQDVKDLLGMQLSANSSSSIKLATLQTLRSYDNADIADSVLGAWSLFTTDVRAEALELLFSRTDWLATLLDAVEEDDFARSNIPSTRVQYLLSHSNASLRAKASTLFEQRSSSEFDAAIEAHQDALTLKGDPAKGRVTFEERCASCHRFKGLGYPLGPDLSTMAARGAETILVNVIDPNREINPQYVNFTIEMNDGNFLTGVLDSETSTSVTLKRAGGLQDTLLRVNMTEMYSSDLSIMPEGLEDSLGSQGMADLIAFLLSDD